MSVLKQMLYLPEVTEVTGWQLDKWIHSLGDSAQWFYEHHLTWLLTWGNWVTTWQMDPFTGGFCTVILRASSDNGYLPEVTEWQLDKWIHSLGDSAQWFYEHHLTWLLTWGNWVTTWQMDPFTGGFCTVILRASSDNGYLPEVTEWQLDKWIHSLGDSAQWFYEHHLTMVTYLR